MKKIYAKHQITGASGQAGVQSPYNRVVWMRLVYDVWGAVIERKVLVFSVLFLLVTLPIFLLVTKYRSKVEAAWMDDAWSYRKAVAIPSHTTLETNVYVTAPTFDATDTSKFQADCGDLRFTKQNGEQLPYFVVDCDATANIHVQFDSLPAGASTYYMYYGNPSVANGFSSADFSTAATGLGTQTLASEEKSAGPVAYWKFDEGNGVTANNSFWKKTGTTTNVITNPSFENASNWWNYGQWSPEGANLYDDVARTTDTNTKLFSASAGKVTISNVDGLSAQSQDLFYSGSIPVASAGQTWSGSNWVKIESNSGITNLTIITVCRTSGGGWLNSNSNGVTTATSWTNLRTSITCGATTTNVVMYLYVNGIDNGDSITFYTDGWQIEQAPSSNMYCDGSVIGNGSHAWNGTANASTSTCDTGTDGDINGATWASEDQCLSDKCLSFDGNDYVNSRNGASTQITTSFTLEGWYKSNTATSDTIISKFQSTTNNRSYYLYVASGGEFRIMISSNGTDQIYRTSTQTASANKWYHVSGVYDSSAQTLKIYINGKEDVGTLTGTVPTSIYNSNANVLIGGADSAGTMNGLIDEVKIYPYARSAAQIKSDFASKGSGSVKGTSVAMGSNAKNNDALSNGLVAYWKSDEASSNGTDSSGNSNTSTVSGSNNYGVGKFGNGLRSGVVTTNLMTNPSAETGLSTWGSWRATNTMITSTSVFGQYAVQTTQTTGLGYTAFTVDNTVPGVTPTQGQTYTCSFYTKTDSAWAGKSGSLSLRESGGSQASAETGVSFTHSTSWQRITATRTIAQSDRTTLDCYISMTGLGGDDGAYFYSDGFQVELAAAITPYVDGSLGTGYSWSGTAHASTSTRTASTATNTTLLNNTSGSLSFWFNSPSLDTSAQCPLGASSGDSTGGLFFGLKSTGVYLYHNYATSQSVTPQYAATINNNTWNHVVYTWDNTTRQGNLYVNGVLQQNVSYSQAITVGEYIQNLGACTRTGYTTFNGTIDDVRDYNRALSGKEVRDLYAWAPGPVGYWNLDEKTGTSANDISGNGFNSTLFIGSPTWKLGKFGSSLDFTGTNKYVTLPAMTGKYSSMLTVSAWVYHTTSANWDDIVAGGCGDILFGFSNNQLNFGGQCNSPFGMLAYTTNINGAWHYVTGTYDGSMARLYVDGIQVNSIARSGSFTPGAITISRTAEDFQGQIDEVKLYNYARTSGQIIEDMNAGHPLGGSPIGSQVGYWKFDEGYGTTSNNTISGGASSIITGASWDNNGKFGKALKFDAIGEIATISTSALGFGTTHGPSTLSLWFKPTNVSATNQYIFSDNCLEWGFVLSNGTLTGYAYSSINATGITNNNWYHAVITHEHPSGLTNTVIKLYLNGQLKSQTTRTITTENGYTDSPYGIGKDNCTASTEFQGYIDEVKIYNAALTADEVKLDYNHGSAMVLGSTSTTSAGVPDNSSTGEYCVPGSSDSCSAPVAEWKMEEGTGVSANDTSGNGKNGTLTCSGSGCSNPTWSSGKNGKGVQFSGLFGSKTNYIQTPNAMDFNNNFTMSFWTKGAENNTWRWWVNLNNYGTGAAGDGAFSITTQGGKVRWSYGTWFTEGVTATTTTLNNTDWYFITIGRSGSQLFTYINGKPEGTWATTSVSNISTTSTMRIGDGPNPTSDVFTGQIDQVRIFNYARTPAQIAWDYNQGKPVGWWKMDECQGIAANDSSGNGNSGTITIGATGTNTSAGTCPGSAGEAWKDGAIGKYNSSLEFDGTDDYVDMGDPSNGSLDFGTGDFTTNTFVKVNGATTFDTIVGKKNSSGSDSGWFVWFDGSTNLAFLTQTTTSNTLVTADSADSTIAKDGNWHMITAVRNNSTLSLYLDGKLIKTNTGTVRNVDNAISLRVGRIIEASTFFNGQIDDVRIYNYALTANQVKTLFNSGAAIQFAPSTGSP